MTQRVKINCPAYKNGKTFYGFITGQKNSITALVLIDGNKKSTSFCFNWLTIIS